MTEKIPKIYASIAAASSDIEAIAKSKKNQQQGFQYRGIDQFYNEIHPVLAKHQIFTTPEVIDEQRETLASKSGGALHFVRLKIKYKFYAVDGSFIEATVIGEGMDSGDKASNKAMAIAHKYALMQVFTVPTEDLIDPDAESHETRPKTLPVPKQGVEKSVQPSTQGTLKELVQAMTDAKWKRDDVTQYATKKYAVEVKFLSPDQINDVCHVMRFKTYKQAMEELK